MFRDTGEDDSAPGGPGEQFGQPAGGDPPVRLQVAIDEDEGARPGFVNRAGNQAPLRPVSQDVEVDGSLLLDRRAHGRQRMLRLRSAPAASQDVGRELALLLQRALALLPASSRRPGDGDLKAAGIGHECLTSVDGPAVGWGCEPFQRLGLDRGEEIQVAPVRVRQLGRAAREELHQPYGGFGDGWHHQSIARRPQLAVVRRDLPEGLGSSARLARLLGLRRSPLPFPPLGQNGPMPRSIWSGSISFGLVNVPVKLVTATSTKDVRFHQLHATDGGRINQRRVCSLDDQEVDYSEIVKGYEIHRGQYVIVEPEELEALAPESSRSIEIEEFVELAAIDPLFFDHSYYLVPDDVAARPYALLVEAMAGTGKVGIGRFVLRTKQYLAALRPRDGALVLSTLLFADEVVETTDLEVKTTGDTRPSERELSMARQLVNSLSAEWEPEKYKDDYREKVLGLLEAKAEGNEFAMPEEPERPAPVVDLMAALEASLARAKESENAPSAEAPARKKRASA